VTLDLTKATFAPGARVDVNGGVGEVIVKVPQNVDVQGTMSTEMGEVIGLNNAKQDGHNAQMTVNDLGADAKAGPSTLTVDLHLKLGSITVERG
jgi:predicted membrane protein